MVHRNKSCIETTSRVVEICFAVIATSRLLGAWLLQIFFPWPLEIWRFKFWPLKSDLSNVTSPTGWTYNRPLIPKLCPSHVFESLLNLVPFFGAPFFLGRSWKESVVDMTIGKPQDRPDKVCRDHSRCHACIKMDYKSFCDVHRGYEFEARVDSVTNTKYIQCTDSFDTCHRSLCECDKVTVILIFLNFHFWHVLGLGVRFSRFGRNLVTGSPHRLGSV